MKRILLRSPKSPFEVVPPLEVYRRNLIGENSGNLVFIHAAHRILSTHDAEVEAGGLTPRPEDADAVNERYDAYVIPYANAFRPRFLPSLERMTRFLEHLRIPVVVLGVGVDATLDYDFSGLRSVDDAARAFVNAVLERSPSIGVRGEATEAYLRTLGFRDVEIVGCPSMFLHGARLPVEKRVAALDRDSPISINVSPYRSEMGDVLLHHLERYRRLVYIAQDRPSLGLMLGVEDPAASATPSRSPVHLSHPVFQQGRARFYVEPWQWISDLRSFDFAFGSRIHGNIAALLAGTPAYLFAHDARTLELARYFAIPHRLLPDVTPDIDAADLYAEADYTDLVAGHAARFERFADYVGRQGLGHVFAGGEDPSRFDARIASIRFPGPVRASVALTRPTSARGRLERARNATRRGARRVTRRLGRLARRALPSA